MKWAEAEGVEGGDREKRSRRRWQGKQRTGRVWLSPSGHMALGRKSNRPWHCWDPGFLLFGRPGCVAFAGRPAHVFFFLSEAPVV